MMKKALILLLIATGSVLLFRCEESSNSPVATGKIQFTPSPAAASTSGRMAAAFPSGTSLLVSIETASGTAVLTREALALQSIGDAYLSPPLALPAGDYALTEFMVQNTAGDIIYATPMSGSTLSSVVDLPLPISFTVTADGVSSLTVAVVDALAAAASDFGYASFTVDVVHAYALSLSVFIPDGDGWTLTNATAIIFHGVDTVSYADLIADENTLVTEAEPDTTYALAVYKPGYAAFRQSFTFPDLLETLDGAPMVVTLDEPAFTFVTNGSTSYFGMYEDGLNLLVDWGDGTTGPLPDLNGGYAPHNFPTDGRYFVSVTGDLDDVTDFYAPYDETTFVDHVTFNQLPALESVSIALSTTPAVIDFSQNTVIHHVNLAGCPTLEELILPEHNNIRFLSISGKNKMKYMKLDAVIWNIYNSVVANNTTEGVFDLSKDWTGQVDGTLYPLAAHLQDLLAELRDDYHWTILPEDF